MTGTREPGGSGADMRGPRRTSRKGSDHIVPNPHAMDSRPTNGRSRNHSRNCVIARASANSYSFRGSHHMQITPTSDCGDLSVSYNFLVTRAATCSESWMPRMVVYSVGTSKPGSETSWAAPGRYNLPRV